MPTAAYLPVAVHGAADFVMSPATRALVEAATSPATRRAYLGDWAKYLTWCTARGRVPAPGTAETLAEYVGHLAEEGARGGPAAPASIARALSVVVVAHGGLGHPRPDTGPAGKALKGYRRKRAAEGLREKQAPPLTLTHLQAMVDVCADSPAGARDRSLLTLGFAGMFRRSELVGFDTADIAEDDKGLVALVRMSKTDQDAVGVEVPIPYGSHPGTCPVRAWRAWMTLRETRGVAEQPLYLRVDKHGAIAGEPGRHLAGMAAASERMDGGSVGLVLRRVAAHAGLPGAADFSAHSLRAGGATQAREGGAEIEAIARSGRWRDGSPVVLRYLRTVDRWKNNAAAFMGL
jgi:integrase